MKILKEAFITKTSIDDIVEMAEKHPLAIERLKKIRDDKKEGYFEDLIKDMYPDGIFLENLFDLLENDADIVEEATGIKFESIDESIHKEPVVVGDTVKLTANNGWNIIYDRYGFGFTDGYRTDRLTVYDDGHWASDSPERLPAYIKREMNKLIDKYGVEFFDRRTTPLNKKLGFEESLKEKFSIGANDIQTVKVYNPYNYTIQELRINNRDKTFERGNFTMWKADKKTHNKQEYEDIVDKLKDMGYTEIPSDYRSLRNKTRKGIPQREELTEANLSDVERQLERAKSAGDDTQAWDLALCIENDEDLYRRFVTPAIENLNRKIKRGVFDETLAIQLFYYVVENSLKDHPRWFPYSLKDVSVPTRYLAAEELVDFFEDEIKSE